jgi:hypothetical protein
LHDRTDQAFGLTQSQAEYGPQGERRLNRKISIVALSAWRRTRLSPPICNGLRSEPDRQAFTIS